MAHCAAALSSFLSVKTLAKSFVGLGFLLAGISCILRLVKWHPLLALYQAPYFAVWAFAGICLFRPFAGDKERRLFFVILAALSLLALFFPKDHYLPFLQTRTVFAFLFMLLGAGARACFFAAAGIAGAWLLSPEGERPAKTVKASWRKWTVWGFALFTASMFSGELWSYLGWGAPIVWEDPAVIAGMVVWFYYALFLHLDLLRFFETHRIAWAAVFGAVVAFAFACLPDMGRLFPPTWMP
ncbi:cytochrome c assembly protein [Desulfatibacillum aliphaticivorans]|uniref:Cytochrome c assembly protein n=1 Tax=Desulfatibacillum aliphaticivorans TaxID=218208 RepID=B8FM06_DESAL|nr:cytochrome c assembly protein [Desulfatibacillum aliphaticivorans]